MSVESPRSVVRSIRISKELDDLIRQDAKSAGGTVNGLISSILTKYGEWDRYAEQFGYVTIARDGFRALLLAIEEEKLIKIAEDFAPSLARELALHWFKQVNLETFLRYLLASFRYGHLGDCQVETGAEGDTLALHHDLGPKYSLLLSRALSESIESIAKISPRVTIEENTFTLFFPAGTLGRSPVA